MGESPPPERTPRAMPAWAVWVVLVLIIVIGVTSGIILIGKFGAGRPEDAASLEALRLAGQIVLGTGGVAALFLAVRRQRWTELALDHQREVAKDTAKDALERRITELYSKAADQIGSDKAPVRLAGLIALDRLGEDSLSQRGKVVDVLCSYLRMPPPLVDLAGDAEAMNIDPQEKEVRKAAQRMLCGRAVASDSSTYWPNMTLDLRGAVLLDFSIQGGEVKELLLSDAHFYGESSFKGCKVGGRLSLAGAVVEGDSNFYDLSVGDLELTKVRFEGGADFNSAKISGALGGDGAQFNGGVEFMGAVISGQAVFANAYLNDCAFSGTQFGHHAQFSGSTFEDYTSFKGANFTQYGDFDKCIFKGDVNFDDVKFGGKARFYSSVMERGFSCERTTFGRDANFASVQFGGAVEFIGTTFRGEAWFPKAIFGDATKFPREHDVRWVSFDKCILHRPLNLSECLFYDRLWISDSLNTNLAGAKAVVNIRHNTPGWPLTGPGVDDGCGRLLAPFEGRDPDDD